jgi:cytochrome c-type biogenesis protein CcmH
VHSDDLKLALGIAMVHSDRASLGTDGGQLIEEVLTAEPNNMQALWYGGMVAIEHGRSDLARDRWARLLTMNPPPDIANVIEQQIAQLGGMPAFAGGGAPAAGPGGDAPGAAAAPGGAANAAGPVIRLHVQLGEGMSSANVSPNASLFIFARAQAGGPPLAVIRQPATAVPGDFTLSDANVMIQGNSLENFEEIRLVARLSMSGQPTEQPGDIYAETMYHLGDEGVVTLTLDQVVQ